MNDHFPLRRARGGRVLCGLLVCAALLAACTGATAKDRGWTIHDPQWSALPQSTAQATAARTRAMAIARALGIRGEPSAVRRERDMMAGIDYDLVEFLSAAGESAQMRLDPETHAPISVVRLGPPDPSESAVVNASNAAGRARAVAQSLGLPAGAEPSSVKWDDAFGAWAVSWTRSIDGHPALGDGVEVDLTRGGRVKAVTATTTPSAPAPANPIPSERAAELATAIATERAWTAKPDYARGDPELVWVRANNFWEPAKPDAPEALLRLAWSVRFSFVAIAGDEPHVIVLWFSAADGSVLGGNETA